MKVSVIIPTLDEESSLPRALASLPPEVEVLVVDGESRDRTREIAGRMGARVLAGPAGRGAQMNRGARAATGEALVFLHADCALGPGAADSIARALSDRRVVGGSFRLRVDSPRLSLRLVAFGSNLRARWLHLPYGDQAIFIRRSAFEAIGGFREIPLMEDLDLVRRIRRRGRMAFLAETVTTSPRHWEYRGALLTTLLNWVTALLFFAGLPATRLASLYCRLRGGRPGVPPSEQPPPVGAGVPLEKSAPEGCARRR